MKIRRIILLVLLAAGSVFLLSSCDAMLDAIFSNNTITVDVSALIPTYCAVIGPNTYYLSLGTDIVTVSATGAKDFTATATYTGNDYNYMYWSVDVPQLSDGTYLVTATYHHPYGRGASAPFDYTWTQSVSLPSGSSHSVNLSFPFSTTIYPYHY